MRTTPAAILFGLLLISSVAHADLTANLNGGMPLLVAIEKALEQGVSVEDVVTQALAAQPGKARLILLAVIAVKPEQLDMIVQAALNAGVDVRVVTSAAIDAGATPAQVADITLYAGGDGIAIGLDDEAESFSDSAVSHQGPASP